MAKNFENPNLPISSQQPNLTNAISVDDKGQPLPDPTEDLSGYIADSEVKSLEKSFDLAEEDEDVRDTMEPPQTTTFFRKHRSGTSRGYDYYGTPAGSIPNDSNGMKPSPLSKLFSEAEPIETGLLKEDENTDKPEPGIKNKVVETPKQASKIKKEVDISDLFAQAGYSAEDPVFKKSTVKMDDDAPRLRDLHKTNTKVIYQSAADMKENGVIKNEPSAPIEETTQLFKEHASVSRAKRRIQKKQERKAIKEQIKLEKKKAKAQKRAEKEARKNRAKAGFEEPVKKAVQAPVVSAPTKEELALAREKREQALIAEKNAKLAQEKAIEQLKKEQELAEKEIENARLEAELAAQKIQEEKERANKKIQETLEMAKKEKEEAKLAAKRAAEEASRQIFEEKEELRRQQEMLEKASQEREKEEKQILLSTHKLEEEKYAAKKAMKDAQEARLEAKKLKMELQAMKDAAEKALAQKQKAEELARAALAEKEKYEVVASKRTAPELAQQEEDIAARLAARFESGDEKNADLKTKQEQNSLNEPDLAAQKLPLTKKKEALSNSKTADEIKRRIAEMESKLNESQSNANKAKGSSNMS